MRWFCLLIKRSWSLIFSFGLAGCNLRQEIAAHRMSVKFSLNIAYLES